MAKRKNASKKTSKPSRRKAAAPAAPAPASAPTPPPDIGALRTAVVNAHQYGVGDYDAACKALYDANDPSPPPEAMAKFNQWGWPKR